MNTGVKTIDFQDFVNMGIYKFDTRSCGLTIRNISQIDSCDLTTQRIVIRIPDNLHRINTIFAIEFLENVINRLGSIDRFKEKVEIKGANYSIKSTIDETVTNVLKEAHLELR